MKPLDRRLPGFEPTAAETEAVAEWWRKTAEDDLAGFEPKWAEYGSRDLAEFGRFLASLADWEGLGDQQLIELGCFGYMLGKMARAQEAYREKRWPSDDTMHDLTVYSMMLRRSREGGL